MKFVLLLVCLLDLSAPDLPSLRNILDQSVSNQKAANAFYEQMKGVKDADLPVMSGFRAMSEFMLCKHLLNPFSRINHFNRGRKLLESAIARDRNSPELLFFRLTTQSNVPALLNYSGNIKGDTQNLISYLETAQGKIHTDKDLHRRIKSYLLISQYCSAEEKALIKRL